VLLQQLLLLAVEQVVQLVFQVLHLQLRCRLLLLRTQLPLQPLLLRWL